MAENEDYNEALALIREWKPESDVYALKHFSLITGGVSAISAAIINSHYRKAVNLRSRLLFSSTVPIFFLPVISSTITHYQFVQRPLLVQNFQCPVCIEIRGGVVQFITGFIYPLVLSAAVSFHFASKLYTCVLPPVTQPMNLLKTFVTLTKPALPKLSILAAVQVIFGMGLTYGEAKNLFTVLTKLSAMEEKVKEHTAAKKRALEPSNWV